MSGNDEPVLEEAEDFFTWESIILLNTLSSSAAADAFTNAFVAGIAAAAADDDDAAFAAAADAFAGIAAAAAAAAAADDDDDDDDAVFDAEDEDEDEDGLLLNPSLPTSFFKKFKSMTSFQLLEESLTAVFAELTATIMIVRGLSNTEMTFIGLKPEIDSPEID
jgi:hypothetical protein